MVRAVSLQVIVTPLAAAIVTSPVPLRRISISVPMGKATLALVGIVTVTAESSVHLLQGARVREGYCFRGGKGQSLRAGLACRHFIVAIQGGIILQCFRKHIIRPRHSRADRSAVPFQQAGEGSRRGGADRIGPRSPWGPVGPWGPVAPVSPVSPLGPVSPWGPAGP